MHLILAAFWLVVAGAVFLQPLYNPAARPWKIPNTDLSAGWFALFLAVYFVLRWWTTRPRREVQLDSRLRKRRRRTDEAAEPIPEFMFDQPSEPNYGNMINADKPGTNGHAKRDPDMEQH